MAFYNYYDQTYADVVRRYNNGNRLSIAVGGDSHGIRLWQQFLELDRRYMMFSNLEIYDECFGVGGGLARTYGTHRGSVNMSRHHLHNFNIVVLMIGSNDPDQFHGRTCWAITRDIESIVLDLTERGQIVYVVAIPSRFTFRRATAMGYVRQNRALGHKLSRMFKNRYITLPPGCYQESSFGREFFGRRIVHLTGERYSQLAVKILRHIDEDLRNAASRPSSLFVFRN